MRKRNTKHIVTAAFLAVAWLFPLLFPVTGAQAAETAIILEGDTEYVRLAGRMSRAVDPTGLAGIAEMTAPERRDGFAPAPGAAGGGYSAEAHWYRFTVIRSGPAPQDWLFSLGMPFVDDIRLYVEDEENGFSEYRLGDHLSPAERPMATRRHAVKLSLPPERPVEFHIRISSNSVLLLDAEIWRTETLITGEIAFSLLQGGYFGILCIIVLVYSLFGIWLRDDALLAYALYVFTLFLLHFGMNGFLSILFDRHPAWLSDVVVGVGSYGSSMVVLLMWDRFLDLRRNFPRLHRLYMGLFLLVLPGLPLVAGPYYGAVNQVFMATAVTSSLISLGLNLHLLIRDGFKPTLLLYFLGFLTSLGGGTLRVAMIMGAIKASLFTEYAYQVSSLAHIILLSGGLAYRIREIDRDRAKAREEEEIFARRAEEQRQFVGMLSHEFRAPINAIDGMAQAIGRKAELLSPGGRERVLRIREQTGRLSGMVESFLAAEALKQGGLALVREETAMIRLLEAVVARHAELVPPGRIELGVEPFDLKAVLDPDMMEVAIGNLVGNALRYSSPESVVRVSAAEGDDGVVITVADQGLGMTEEEIARIGNIYFRAGSSKGTKGTGLGLHMAHMIVSAHGGTWAIESTPGLGTSISISLPRNGGGG